MLKSDKYIVEDIKDLLDTCHINYVKGSKKDKLVKILYDNSEHMKDFLTHEINHTDVSSAIKRTAETHIDHSYIVSNIKKQKLQ